MGLYKASSRMHQVLHCRIRFLPCTCHTSYLRIHDAAELVPIDMDSDGGLGGTSAELFGPLAVVLVGYFPAELETFRSFMIAMEADMVKVGLTNNTMHKYHPPCQ